jgi:hypothetical protein
MTRFPFCNIFTKFGIIMYFMNLRNRSLNLEGTMRVLNVTKGIRVTETGIRLSADTECKEQRAAAPGQNVEVVFYVAV